MTPGFLDRLLQHRVPGPPAVFDGLAQARAYWEGLRRGGALPLRQAIDPRGLAGVLDRLFLAERIARGIAGVRIAGSTLTDFAGTEVRGLPLSCLFSPDSRGLLAETLEQVFAEPALAEIDLGSDRASRGGPVARLLLLPVAEDPGTRLVLGVLGFASPRPSRCKLQILSRRTECLLTETATSGPTMPQVTPIRRIAHLSLVHSAE